MKEYANDLLNYPYTVRVQASHKKGEADNRRFYCEDIFTFDIETTSFFYESDKKPFLYQKGLDPEYWAGVYAGALPYMWQFGVNGTYFYGRDIKDFYDLLDHFPPDLHIRIAVHNLSFEWHFLDRLTWSKVFAKSAHKPITASCSEHPNIQFYCTLSLENRSLASWGKDLGVPKFSGMIDYNQMLTPKSPLDEDHLKYGEQDLRVMYEGIKKELREYGSVWKLPLTSTGKIRKICRDMLLEDKAYVNFIKKLVPENPYQYKTSMAVFAGGYTHANRLHVNETLYNEDGLHGGHYDYTSSYPTEMLEKMPMTTWAYWDKRIPERELFKDHAFKMHLIFKGIRSELQNNYIPSAHCEVVGGRIDNGRVMYADSLELWCTEQDFQIIEATYTWTDLIVCEVWEAKKGYLPIKFVQYVLQLFHDKTALKGVDDEGYKLAKARLNSLFGMCVTALLQSEIIWDIEAEDWTIKRITENQIIEHLDKLRRFKDKRYFLNYDWGVWIANGARCRLWRDLIIPYDKHVIYADTDSIFTDIHIDFHDYNARIIKHIEDICNERGLDVNLTRPKNLKGEVSYLGVLTSEEEWESFRTLGAKRYCERWKSDGKLHLTVAGINKEAVTCLNDDIENFKNGVVFDKDSDDVSKLLHTYFENQPDIVFPDGYVSHQRRGVNLRPNGYRMTVDPTFNDIIAGVANGLKNEQYENHLKSVWYDDIDELIDYAMKGGT